MTIPCPSCAGTGSETAGRFSPKDVNTCRECGGEGEIHHDDIDDNTWDGGWQ